MVSSGRHPRNAINTALQSLDAAHFEVIEIHRGHRWGVVACIICGAEAAIWSTPRVPENNANAIIRFAAKHDHEED